MSDNVLIGLRVSKNMFDQLSKKYPKSIKRNIVLRTLIYNLLEGKIIIDSYPVDLDLDNEEEETNANA